MSPLHVLHWLTHTQGSQSITRNHHEEEPDIPLECLEGRDQLDVGWWQAASHKRAKEKWYVVWQNTWVWETLHIPHSWWSLWSPSLGGLNRRRVGRLQYPSRERIKSSDNSETSPWQSFGQNLETVVLIMMCPRDASKCGNYRVLGIFFGEESISRMVYLVSIHTRISSFRSSSLRLFVLGVVLSRPRSRLIRTSFFPDSETTGSCWFFLVVCLVTALRKNRLKDNLSVKMSHDQTKIDAMLVIHFFHSVFDLEMHRKSSHSWWRLSWEQDTHLLIIIILLPVITSRCDLFVVKQ